MKFFLTILSIAFFSVSAKCQLDKHTWLIGGSGSFYAYHQNYATANTAYTAKFTNIDATVKAGYFLMDKLSLGLASTFSSYKGRTSGGGEVNQYNLLIGPFARYYFLDREKDFNLLAEVSYDAGSNRWLMTKEKGKYNRLLLMAGPEFFFNTSTGLEVLFGYNKTNRTINAPDGFQDRRQGFQIAIGFLFHLEKR